MTTAELQDMKETARQIRNWGILLNVIQYNFGAEALAAFKLLTETMQNPEAWSEQVAAAWRVFEREIINHK